MAKNKHQDIVLTPVLCNVCAYDIKFQYVDYIALAIQIELENVNEL